MSWRSPGPPELVWEPVTVSMGPPPLCSPTSSSWTAWCPSANWTQKRSRGCPTASAAADAVPPPADPRAWASTSMPADGPATAAMPSLTRVSSPGHGRKNTWEGYNAYTLERTLRVHDVVSLGVPARRGPVLWSHVLDVRSRLCASSLRFCRFRPSTRAWSWTCPQRRVARIPGDLAVRLQRTMPITSDWTTADRLVHAGADLHFGGHACR